MTVGSPFTGTASIRIPRALTQSGQDTKADTWLRRMSQEIMLKFRKVIWDGEYATT